MFPSLSSYFLPKAQTQSAKKQVQTATSGHKQEEPGRRNGPLILELLYNNSPALMDALEIQNSGKESSDTLAPLLWASPKRSAHANSRRIDLGCPNEDGDTVWFRTATTADYPKATRALIRAGIDPNLQDKHGRDALTLNTLKRHNKTVKEILDYKTEPNKDNAVEDIRLLFGEEPLDALSLTQDKQGDTALTHALKEKNNDAVYLLTQAGVETDATNKKGESAIILAAKHGDPFALIRLLNNDANANMRDKDGKTVLMHWLSNMKPTSGWEALNYDIGDALFGLNHAYRLHRYIRPDRFLRPSTELWSRFGATQHLYTKISDENMLLQDKQGRSAFSYLASSPLCHTAFGQAIAFKALEHNADPDEQDQAGMTPLMHWALNKPKNRIEKALCQNFGIFAFTPHINRQDEQGKTALIHAAGCGNFAAIKLLTDNPLSRPPNADTLDPNIQDDQGQTALMKLACFDFPQYEAPKEDTRALMTRIMLPRHPKPIPSYYNELYDSVYELLKIGANPTLKDKSGNTAITLAAENRNASFLKAICTFPTL